MSEIDHLAGLVGIEDGYWDVAGQWHATPAGTKRALIAALRLDSADTAGIEAAAGDLSWSDPGGPVPACPLPQDLGIGRAWGVTCQAYGLRSARNGAIGDFEDIAVLAERLAAAGADFLGLSPLHALFPEDPARYSPYSPSSRRWLNELLIAVDAASGELGLPSIKIEGAERLRAAELIDYPAVAGAKGAALERLWQAFRGDHLQGAGTATGQAFRTWQADQGDDLERFCRFQMLAGLVARERGQAVPFQAWPPALRRPDARDVALLAGRERESVDRRAFLQWVADRQLASARARPRRRHADRALRRPCHRGRPGRGRGLGGPGHPGQRRHDGRTARPLGAVWPELERGGALAARARAHRRGTLARHPAGRDAPCGCDAHRPCAGAPAAVPDPARRQRRRRRLRALPLSLAAPRRGRGGADGGLRRGRRGPGHRPGRLPRAHARSRPARLPGGVVRARLARRPELPAARAVSRPGHGGGLDHNLPTVRGWFAARDILWRERLGLYPDPGRAGADQGQRAHEAGLLLDRLRALRLLGEEEDDEARTLALHRYLARSASTLAAVQLEDLAGEFEQPNLPGTIAEHPNWRRRYLRPADELTTAPLAARILAIMAAERPR